MNYLKSFSFVISSVTKWMCLINFILFPTTSQFLYYKLQPDCKNQMFEVYISAHLRSMHHINICTICVCTSHSDYMYIRWLPYQETEGLVVAWHLGKMVAKQETTIGDHFNQPTHTFLAPPGTFCIVCLWGSNILNDMSGRISSHACGKTWCFPNP